MSDNGLSKIAANEQLMSCPFCGGKARVSEHVVPVTRFLDSGRRRITSEFVYGITCQKCGAMSSQYYETMGEAIGAWNTRHEMSAREFVIAHHRMCQSKMECVECRICHDDGEPRSCAVLMGLNPDDTVAVVEKWAKEHPEEENDG